MSRWEWWWITLTLWRTYRALCGHDTKRIGVVTAFGETIQPYLFLNKEGKVEYCLDCIRRMAIPCAWCGEAIWLGEPVTLLTPTDPLYQPPEGAVAYSHDPLQLVGCLRMNCADTGADRAGFWIAPGKVRRVMSPLEIYLATDAPVIVNNLSDPQAAIPFPEGT